MQENNPQGYSAWLPTIFQAITFSAIGVMIAVGQILQNNDPITWRVAVGRCITSGGLALVAGSGLALIPDLPFIALVGLAAMLASLGNSGLEMLLRRVLRR